MPQPLPGCTCRVFADLEVSLSTIHTFLLDALGSNVAAPPVRAAGAGGSKRQILKGNVSTLTAGRARGSDAGESPRASTLGMDGPGSASRRVMASSPTPSSQSGRGGEVPWRGIQYIGAHAASALPRAPSRWWDRLPRCCGFTLVGAPFPQLERSTTAAG